MALIHKMSVKSRKISISNRNFVQGGVNSDAFQIELDDEFTECERVLVSMKRDDTTDDPLVFELPEDKLIKVPSEILDEVGTFKVGVVGYDADGNARITTEAIADGKECVVVEASFIVDSENPPSEEQQDIFQQLEGFVKDAQAALDEFDDASMSIGTVETLDPEQQATASFTGEGLQKVLNLGIPKGIKGDKGDKGDPGAPGEQGIQGAPGADGKNGQDGTPGADGFSPTVEVSKDGSVTTISITDKTGLKTAEISDGAKGDKGDKGDPGAPGVDGQNGADGFSPTVDVSKSGTVTTISITDKAGVKTAEISDGAKGDKGDTGVGIPNGGTTGDFVQKTATGTGWFNSEGLLRASYIGTLQQIGDEGQSLEIHDVSVTSNSYIAGIDSADHQTDGSYVYARDSNVVSASEHRVGVKDGTPYVSLQSTPPSGMEDAAASDGVYTYVDDIDKADEVSEANSVTNLSIPTSTAVKKYVATHATTNILAGTATGNVAHAEDAYAAKPRGVRVKGRTIRNLWPVINSTGNGTTVSTDDAGLVTVSGTPTAYKSHEVKISLVPGETYAVSMSEKPSAFALQIMQVTEAGNIYNNNNNGSTSFAFTASQEASAVYAQVIIPSASIGTEIDASFRVMLVEGDTAPDCFTPTGIHSAQPEKIVMTGKNLLITKPHLSQQTIAGVTFTPLEDGGIKMNGTTTGTAYYNLDFDSTYDTGTAYVGSLAGEIISGNSLNGNKDYLLNVSFFTDDETSYVITNTNRTSRIPINATKFRTFISIDSGVTVNMIYYPQIELGSTATSYEPPNVTEIALPEMEPLMSIDDYADELVIEEDGTARVIRRVDADSMTALESEQVEELPNITLPALPAPTTNLYTTGGYVPGTTSLEYERDVNIAFKNLEDIVNGLIGD